jgi:hypothetical protein
MLLANFFTTVTSSNWFMDVNDDSSIDITDLDAVLSAFGHSTSGSYSGPIMWNGLPPLDLYYSSKWQVLEEDTQNPTTQTAAQYVWGLAYVDEMVLRDRDSDGDPTTGDLGISGSGLDGRLNKRCG